MGNYVPYANFLTVYSLMHDLNSFLVFQSGTRWFAQVLLNWCTVVPTSELPDLSNDRQQHPHLDVPSLIWTWLKCRTENNGVWSLYCCMWLTGFYNQLRRIVRYVGQLNWVWACVRFVEFMGGLCLFVNLGSIISL